MSFPYIKRGPDDKLSGPLFGYAAMDVRLEECAPRSRQSFHWDKDYSLLGCSSSYYRKA